MHDIKSESPLGLGAVGRATHTLGVDRRISAATTIRTATLLAVPALVVCVLAWPLLFTDAAFNEDWVHHLWFIWNQSLAVRESYHPSFFLHYSYSVFYPEYAFYGGTLYALVGALSLALGDAPIAAYIAAYLAGFVIACAGWYWLARMARIGRWWALLPGLIFITSSYYITLIYARGDLQEFLAISIIPLLIASALTILRAGRLSLGTAFALAAASIVFFGTHNLTMVWGSTLIALTGALVLIWIPRTRSWVTRRGLLCVAVLVLPGLLVNAWFLLPALAYESRTLITHEMTRWATLLREFMYVIPARNLFSTARTTVFPGSNFALSLPVLAMAWSAIGVVLYWWRRAAQRSDWLRLFAICAVLMIVVIVVMTHAGIILALPRPYAILQFAYRLESYVMLFTGATVLVVLAMAERSTGRSRLWRWVLVAVAIFSTVAAAEQTSRYPRTGGTREGIVGSVAHARISLIGLGNYLDVNLPLRRDPYGTPPVVVFPVSAVHADRVSQVVHLRPHQWVFTNIGGGPEFVHVTGAKIVGRDGGGHDVLEIGSSDAGAKQRRAGGALPAEVITVSAASGPVVVLGRALSLVGVALLLGVFATLFVRRLRGAPAR